MEIDLKAITEMKVRPRLSSYAENLERAGDALKELRLGVGDGEIGIG